MKIRIECTIDEMFEISYALTKRSRKVLMAVLERSHIIGTALASFFSFVFTYYLTGNILHGLLALIITIGLGAILISISRDESPDKKIIQIMCEEYFEKNPNHYCEYELNENGISCNSDSVLSHFEWSKIEEIEESSASYLFFSNDLRGLSIQKRAFKTEDEKKEFETFIQQHTDKFKK